jgi:hypothetical protein
MTIHITPEPEFSYVSFESNIPLRYNIYNIYHPTRVQSYDF